MYQISKSFFTKYSLLILFISLSFYSSAQTSEVLPNSINIPSVSILPTGSIGKIVFKTPENKLYTFDGTNWKQLQVVSQEGFSCQIKNILSINGYPNSPTVVNLNTPEFQLGEGIIENNSYTVSQTGVYQINASFTTGLFESTPSLFFLTIYIFKNNSVLRMNPANNLSSSMNTTVRLSDMLLLNAGDVIQMKISHNYSGSMNCNGSGSYFSLLKIY